MKFEITNVHLMNEDPPLATTMTVQRDGMQIIPTDEFDVGTEVEIAVFESEPDLSRYLAAVSEARRARVAHTELRSGDGDEHEDRALSLLLGEIDP